MSFTDNENSSLEQNTTPKKTIGNYGSNSALEHLKRKVTANNFDSKEENTTEKKNTILDICMPYVIDENGEDTSVESAPLYELQSVADILKEQSQKSIDSLSKKYDMIFEDLTAPNQEEKKVIEKTEEEKNKNNDNLVSKKIKNVQSNVSFVISDIDSTTITPSKDMSDTATITFTPVSSDDTTKKINISTNTKQIDLTNELVKVPETFIEETETPHNLEKSEFEEFVPDNEIKNDKDALKIKRHYAIMRRNSFFATLISFFITGLLSLGKTPVLSQFIIASTRTAMIICSSLALVVILSNLSMFVSIKKLLRKSFETDILPTIASIVTIPFAIIAISQSYMILDVLILLCFVLSFRALSNLLKTSYIYQNLKFATSPQPKQAIKLISDQAITSSLARNSIEGDSLIATQLGFKNLTDLMKYTTYGKPLGGKLSLITLISLILSVIMGFVSAIYFGGFINGLYTATAIQCFASLPCLFFIDTFPLFASSRKLKKSGAAIFGKTAAEQIELANAFVINSADIFPKGTISLYKMQVLSENNLEDTLIRAASLTEYTGNTLAPIFKSIVNTGNISVLPDADTVKYEERLGISGWVDNRLLFIGNRTLMETHGIKVPSIDVDRKILSQGYFPVYVATREKACALLIIQYSVDHKIAKELRKITNIGVTMLVNNTDPNITEEMLCDYIGLYEDSVRVMSSAGSYMHKNATVPVDTISAPAVFKKNPIALPTVLNCATKIKRSNFLLNICYVICASLGVIIFAYTSFKGSGEPLSQTVTLLYGIITTVISYFIYLFDRP